MEKSTTKTENQKYSVLITNQSNRAWKFVIYQNTPPDANRLAWLVTPYNIDKRNSYCFSWETGYQFMWVATGDLGLQKGYIAEGIQDCNPDGNNQTKFTVTNNTPALSSPTTGAKKGTLKIIDGPDVPPNRFSVGLAMYQRGIYVQDAGPNLTHMFTPDPIPSYWVCGMNDVEEGSVIKLMTIITPSEELYFPSNVYNLNATLNSDNTWKII